MNKLFLFAGALLLCLSTQAQIKISEVVAGEMVELYNESDNPVNVSSLWLCDFPAYTQIADLDIICGSFVIPPQGTLTVYGWTVDEADSELGLYATNSFGSPAAMMDYVEWGSTGHQRSSVAVAAGLWTTGSFAPAMNSGFVSLVRMDVDATDASGWVVRLPEICFVPYNETVLCSGDLNLSGTVDVADLLVLLGQFGSVCN